eukprot:1195782-Prorocentrum_minimum.AAC.2
MRRSGSIIRCSTARARWGSTAGLASRGRSTAGLAGGLLQRSLLGVYCSARWGSTAALAGIGALLTAGVAHQARLDRSYHLRKNPSERCSRPPASPAVDPRWGSIILQGSLEVYCRARWGSTAGLVGGLLQGSLGVYCSARWDRYFPCDAGALLSTHRGCRTKQGLIDPIT